MISTVDGGLKDGMAKKFTHAGLYSAVHVSICAGLAFGMASMQCATGVALGAGPMYYMGVTAGAAHVLWQVYDVDLDSAPSCLQKFKSNTVMGALPMAGFVLDRLYST